MMRITAYGKTDRGRRRPNNEDDLALIDLASGKTIEDYRVGNREISRRGILLAVCDGVGGQRAGEVASALALESLVEELDLLPDGCPAPDRFRCAVENVNARVWRESGFERRLKGMATTLTAALVCPSRTIIAHVGDSRAYVLRGAGIRQITRDQSFVASLVAAGTLTEEDAARSPYRNVILQAIGREQSVEVALDGVDLSPGDLLLLCTDGLSEKVQAEEMARVLRKKPVEEAVEELVATANERGGEDNITVLVGRIEEEAP